MFEVRLVGDIGHMTKFETAATSARQQRVRSLERVGGPTRTKNGLSTIRDVARCAATGPWEHHVEVHDNLAGSKT